MAGLANIPLGNNGFPGFENEALPVVVSAFANPQGKAVLAFKWPDAPLGSGYTLDHYEAILWANPERTQVLSGGDRYSTGLITTATFNGVPRGASFLLDIQAVGSGGQVSAPLSLIGTSPIAGATPALTPTPVLTGETEADPIQEDISGILFGMRPYYGTVAGVKHWSRIVSFGTGKDQVTDLDVLYFLMAASDAFDSALSGRWVVPLTKYREAQSPAWRYPSNVAFMADRKAAGMLIQARKSSLTEQEASYATSLEQYADAQIEKLAGGQYLAGQTLTHGALPRVVAAYPQHFTMPGDSRGQLYEPVLGGVADQRYLRQSSSGFVQQGWRFGGRGMGGSMGG